MTKIKISRREAMDRLLKIVAIATGMTVTEVKSLLSGQVKLQQPQKQKTIIYQKSANKSIKTLKALLENDRAIFENEFGRSTPVRQASSEKLFSTSQHLLPKDRLQQGNFMDHFNDMVNDCGRNFGVPGNLPGFDNFICTGTNTCSGQDVGGGSGCAGTNECNGQSCESFVCSGNDCDDQSCSDFEICENNKSSIISIAELEQFKTDPYIQVLFERYNVKTTTELMAQINRSLNQLRLGIKTQVIR